MGRSARQLPDGCSFHITLRCNIRAFLIARGVRRDLLLAVLRKAQEKLGFRLHGICLMANHLHLLLQPAQVRDLPRIMQWIGWYSTMALSRLTGRCGHFWEARYFSSPIDPGDTRRVLATLRYIHANPKAAGVRKGFHDPYSNYGHYERLEGDVPEVIRSSAGATGQGRSRPANLTGAATAATGWRQWRQGRWPQGSYLCRCNGSSWRRGSGGPMGLGPETGRRSCCCNRCSLSGLWQKTETGIQM
jgi:REP element-mobilizing transposase RayT